MNPTDPLSQLKDIHLPAEPGLWPLAPGWWILVLLSVVLISIAVLLVRRHTNKNRYRKVALKQLDTLTSEYSKQVVKPIQIHIEQSISLLKRAALHGNNHHESKEKITSSSASQCLELLNQRCKKPVFSEQICTQIGPLLYSANSASDQPELNIQEFHQMMKTWIKCHR